eukprot:15263944-Alexandrium_andersonii.AAC.1
MLERFLGLQLNPLVAGQVAYRSNVEQQRRLAARQRRLDVERWRRAGGACLRAGRDRGQVGHVTFLARVELSASGARPRMGVRDGLRCDK